ncbi:MAG: hypothetical protein WA897_12720, partial [Moheibacter sp.]
DPATDSEQSPELKEEEKVEIEESLSFDFLMIQPIPSVLEVNQFSIIGGNCSAFFIGLIFYNSQ